jgi:hypothetical protein
VNFVKQGTAGDTTCRTGDAKARGHSKSVLMEENVALNVLPTFPVMPTRSPAGSDVTDGVPPDDNVTSLNNASSEFNSFYFYEVSCLGVSHFKTRATANDPCIHLCRSVTARKNILTSNRESAFHF